MPILRFLYFIVRLRSINTGECYFHTKKNESENCVFFNMMFKLT